MSLINESYRAELETIREIFERKSTAYGKDNIKDSGTPVEEALGSLFFRIRDKVNRFNRLATNGVEAGDETMVDTLRDLANYALIACVVAKGEWE